LSDSEIANLEVDGTCSVKGLFSVTNNTDITIAGTSFSGGSIATLGGLSLQESIGIEKDAYVGNNMYIYGDTIGGIDESGNVSGAMQVTGGICIKNNIVVGTTATIYGSTPASGTTSDDITGALEVTGGIGIKNNLVVGNTFDIYGELTSHNKMYLKNSSINYLEEDSNIVVPKSYVDSISVGINMIGPCYVATTISEDLTTLQNNINSWYIFDSTGIITGYQVGTTITIDGVTLPTSFPGYDSTNDTDPWAIEGTGDGTSEPFYYRILIKNQSSTTQIPVSTISNPLNLGTTAPITYEIPESLSSLVCLDPLNLGTNALTTTEIIDSLSSLGCLNLTVNETAATTYEIPESLSSLGCLNPLNLGTNALTTNEIIATLSSLGCLNLTSTPLINEEIPNSTTNLGTLGSDPVLQTLPGGVDNGAYILKPQFSSEGSLELARILPLDNGDNANSVITTIIDGTTNKRSTFVQVNQNAIVGTDPLSFEYFHKSQFEILGSTLIYNNGVLNVNPELIIDTLTISSTVGGTTSADSYALTCSGGIKTGAGSYFGDTITAEKGLDVAGEVHITSSTNTTGGLSSGALQVSGGCYIAQDLYIAGTISVQGGIDIGNYTFTDLTCTTLNATTSISTVNYYTTSDYRIKDNVTDLTDSFTVDNLRPVSYVHKDTEKPSIGFIAHEVQEHFPELVTGEKDGDDIQTLNYIGLIGVLVKEIQDLKARVNELEKSN
jgi:hypothetical protein